MLTYIQEPYQWPSVANISRKVLSLRYELLPYYYTLFYKASRPVTSTPSATVTRPLFFEFPNDSTTYPIDRQFMVGNALLISPVLEQGQLILFIIIMCGWDDFTRIIYIHKVRNFDSGIMLKYCRQVGSYVTKCILKASLNNKFAFF